jgi:hypothetical protein
MTHDKSTRRPRINWRQSGRVLRMEALENRSLLAVVVSEWSVTDGGNGHAYAQVFVESEIDWVSAKAAAETLEYRGVHGHLVSITSEAEQNFVAHLFDGGRTWIGLTDDPAYGGSESRGQPNYQVDGWVWVTGEPVGYVNWYHPNEPNNQGGDENFGMMEGAGSGGWNDVSHDWFFSSYIVEFDVVTPWHNHEFPEDVNNSGEATAQDVLAVVNYINAFGITTVPRDSNPGQPWGFLDINGDNLVTPQDVLAVVNYVNSGEIRGVRAEGEEESLASAKERPQAAAAIAIAELTPDDLLCLLATDEMRPSSRRR